MGIASFCVAGAGPHSSGRGRGILCSRGSGGPVGRGAPCTGPQPRGLPADQALEVHRGCGGHLCGVGDGQGSPGALPTPPLPRGLGPHHCPKEPQPGTRPSRPQRRSFARSCRLNTGIVILSHYRTRCRKEIQGGRGGGEGGQRGASEELPRGLALVLQPVLLHMHTHHGHQATTSAASTVQARDETVSHGP